MSALVLRPSLDLETFCKVLNTGNKTDKATAIQLFSYSAATTVYVTIKLITGNASRILQHLSQPFITVRNLRIFREGALSVIW